MRWILILAGVYNLLWGAWVVLFPGHLFELSGIAPPEYSFLWQGMGMVIGVYGVGYLIASGDPARHWPIVLVGLMGKVLGPPGIIVNILAGEIPWKMFLYMNITNDLIWIIPFSYILWKAWRIRSASGGNH